jgi:pilus assembly protein CpaD
LRCLALAGLCALLVSACDRLRQMEQDRNAVAVGLSNAEVRHPIGFTPRTESLEVEVPPGAEGLSPNQHVDLYRFLHRFKREAVGRLVITAPDAVRDRAAMAKSLQEIQQQVAGAGVDYRLLRGARHNARADGAPFVRLAYRRPVAVPPVCDQWTEDVGRNEARIPHPNWGCATQRNLAVMVDNARDLEQPQFEDPRSGERRAVSWSGYVGSSATTTATSEGGDTGKKASAAAPKK